MLIENKTSVTLTIEGISLKPGDYLTRVELEGDTLDIYSDIGSTKITTMEKSRDIQNTGRLVATEDKVEDWRGRKHIIIRALPKEKAK